jgi:SLT domain-containing protein
MADDVSNAQETNMNYSQLLLQAVESHFIAKKTKAIANLNNYLQHPAAIGEHPDLVEETIKLFEDVSHADGLLDTIKKVIQ